MSKILGIGVALLLVIVLALYAITYQVSYHEVAVQTQFGQSDEQGVQTEPGLKFRIPFFSSVKKLDRRIQIQQVSFDTLQTNDGHQVLIKSFLLWKVDTEDPEGPLKFFRTYDGSIAVAKDMLAGQLRDALSVISQFDYEDLLGTDSKLIEAEERVLEKLSFLKDSGIQPVAVGISQISLPPKTATAVLGRMEADRNALGESERNRGKAEAERIRSEARAKRDKIKAFALQRAQEIQAVANERAAEYLAQMSQDEELAIFLVWLDALQTALSENTTVILETDFAPWHLMDGPNGGIPKPNRQIGEPAPTSSSRGSTASTAAVTNENAGGVANE